jgi:predicted membrane protein
MAFGLNGWLFCSKNISLLTPFNNKYPLQRDIFCLAEASLLCALWALIGALLHMCCLELRSKCMALWALCGAKLQMVGFGNLGLLWKEVLAWLCPNSSSQLLALSCSSLRSRMSHRYATLHSLLFYRIVAALQLLTPLRCAH